MGGDYGAARAAVRHGSGGSSGGASDAGSAREDGARARRSLQRAAAADRGLADARRDGGSAGYGHDGRAGAPARHVRFFPPRAAGRHPGSDQARLRRGKSAAERRDAGNFRHGNGRRERKDSRERRKRRERGGRADHQIRQFAHHGSDSAPRVRHSHGTAGEALPRALPHRRRAAGGGKSAEAPAGVDHRAAEADGGSFARGKAHPAGRTHPNSGFREGRRLARFRAPDGLRRVDRHAYSRQRRAAAGVARAGLFLRRPGDVPENHHGSGRHFPRHGTDGIRQIDDAV